MYLTDEHRVYKTPCPDCNGEVEYWFFVSAGTAGTQCKGCKKEYTQTEWEKIAYEELRPEREAREKAMLDSETRRKRIMKQILAKLTPEEKEVLRIYGIY